MSDGAVQILGGKVLTTHDAGVATADECCCWNCTCDAAQPGASAVTADCDTCFPLDEAECIKCQQAYNWGGRAYDPTPERCVYAWSGVDWLIGLWLTEYPDGHIEVILDGDDFFFNLNAEGDVECIAGVWTGTVVLTSGRCAMTATVTFG